ncbi:hypothetical protein [Providencia vermicola]|uniref:hypothetical protein n=1 Tax=Providencia vermicola TaxID=333965 RepID=UPI002AA16233|nr:hypothetical protein [Providencia stuartii]
MKISRIVSHSFISTQCIAINMRFAGAGLARKRCGWGWCLVVTVRQKDDKTVSHPPNAKKPPIGWLSH